jgi:hypothetical protein
MSLAARSCVVLGGVLAATTAAADTFEAAARGARSVRHIDDLVWALTTPCDRGTDLEQRQCRQVRDARAASLTGTTLRVEAEPSALAVAAWSQATKSVAVKLSSCIACAGITVEGRTWFVTGGPAALHDNAQQFPDEAAANRWISAAKHPRVELLVKVPDQRRWVVSGKDGVQLEIVGYRVVTPCTGDVLLARPAASKLAPDPRACPAVAKPATAVPPARP